jgi:hypothetical protein
MTYRPSAILIACLALFATLGCSSGPKRGAIAGNVTIAGKPLPSGRILFVPAAPLEGPAVSAVIAGGAYELPRNEGPLVGPHRVEVEADPDLGFALDDEQAYAARGRRPLPPGPIPPAFNRQSQLAVDIQPGDNTFHVAIPAGR